MSSLLFIFGFVESSQTRNRVNYRVEKNYWENTQWLKFCSTRRYSQLWSDRASALQRLVLLNPFQAASYVVSEWESNKLAEIMFFSSDQRKIERSVTETREKPESLVPNRSFFPGNLIPPQWCCHQRIQMACPSLVPLRLMDRMKRISFSSWVF